MRMLLRSIFLGVSLLALPVLAIVADGLIDAIQPSDVAVVLGNKVERTGRPSARLQARLDRTVELYNAGLVGNIIVSGGKGKEGFDEAQVMKTYLVTKGIGRGKIVVDSQGVTTRATAENAAQLMRQNGWTSAMVVSQYFHVPRSRLALKQAGVRDVSSVHAHYFEWRDIYSLAREVVAYGTYWVGGK